MSGIINSIGSKSRVIDNISMKIITGTTADANNFTVAHGLAESKILLVSAIINPSVGDYFMPQYRPAGTSYAFNYYVIGGNIQFVDTPVNLRGDPYKIFIMYMS